MVNKKLELLLKFVEQQHKMRLHILNMINKQHKMRLHILNMINEYNNTDSDNDSDDNDSDDGYVKNFKRLERIKEQEQERKIILNNLEQGMGKIRTFRMIDDELHEIHDSNNNNNM